MGETETPALTEGGGMKRPLEAELIEIENRAQLLDQPRVTLQKAKQIHPRDKEEIWDKFESDCDRLRRDILYLVSVIRTGSNCEPSWFDSEIGEEAGRAGTPASPSRSL